MPNSPYLLSVIPSVREERLLYFSKKSPNQSAPISACAEKKYHAKLFYSTKTLSEIQTEASDYVTRKNQTEPNKTFLIPFGLDSDDYNEILESQLRKAIPEDFPTPKTLWLTVGSGTILRVLGKIWPNTQFMPVQVGKKLWEDQYTPDLWKRIGGYSRIEKLKAPQKFFEPVSRKLRPPYPSVASYDAKVWQHILQEGEEGDFIWNVAKDIDFNEERTGSKL
jgi:hypothetical protein